MANDSTLLHRLQALEDMDMLAQLPGYIPENLSPRFALRPYQEQALRYFITYFEHPRLRGLTDRVLFQMATGSGKTAVMAGLILYLYSRGYRSFLFFVSLSNIVEQTRRVFLDPASPKALFREKLAIGGKTVPVREVRNFQDVDPEAVNLVFVTTQGLHAMRQPRENSLSLSDFGAQPTVLLSDETHHLGAATKKGLTQQEELERTWEHTVDQVLSANAGSVLLQFTATADASTPELAEQNRRRTIMDYPLSRFREDGYSKEIKTLRTDVSVMDRALLAVVLSQYRLKRFQERRLSIKPVVLFKAASVAESRSFQEQFIRGVERLDRAALERLEGLTRSPVLLGAFRYFRERGITLEQLALELRVEFGRERCISANDDGEAWERQLLLNSLESPLNPYRAVFEVRKLDEGWDVLNLFDIVRLYETRQSGGRGVSPATVAEAQLIGRGARYCPFRFSEEDDPFRRKLDGDLDSPFRVCEELYYHCQNEHRYITELQQALRQTGAIPDAMAECSLTLRPGFRASPLYQEGQVLVNRRRSVDPARPWTLSRDIREAVFDVSFYTGASGEDTVFTQGSREDESAPARVLTVTLARLAAWNYSVVLLAMDRHEVFRFGALKRRLPGLTSLRELVTSPDWLGGVALRLHTVRPVLTPELAAEGCRAAFEALARALEETYGEWRGTERFEPVPLREVFTDKTVRVEDPSGDGAGIPQRLCADPALRLDLSGEDWYAYTENYGTPEEKALTVEVRALLPRLRQEFDQVFLLRSERQLVLYDFARGRRFEPDYLLLLCRPGLQLQVLLEPKGEGFAEGDRWKEDFLLSLEGTVPPAALPDGTAARVAGTRFFNRGSAAAFRHDLEELLRRFPRS